jgi:predicted secreted protein
MAGFIGRDALLTKNSVVLAGVRTKGFNWSGESVDVTSGEDNGIRLLLDASGKEQIDIPIDGILKEDTLLNIIMDTTQSKMLTDIELLFAIITPGNTTKASLTGNFRISGFEAGMAYEEGTTFTGTLESSGAWVWTPEAA